MSEYAHPDVLVSTDWVAEHLNDPGVRIAECDEDVLLYEIGHIPGAIKLDWHTDLQNATVRDFISKSEFEELCASHGISNDTMVVFYGDRNNWYATYSFWLFQLYGHRKMAIMNGGRQKWIDEGREQAKEVPSYPRTSYTAKDADTRIRAFRAQVEEHIKDRENNRLVDVRSPQEYTGETIHMPNYPQEGAQRGGHIPSARSIPWAKAANEDGTFRSREELEALYGGETVTPDKNVIAYCRIGERSSHTWFVLTHLLGYPNVRNYDGSWTEWGNLVGAPIEKP
jgi:thiosulfate/3-mercaptopyruvate sulfurtransferase